MAAALSSCYAADFGVHFGTAGSLPVGASF